MEDKKEKPKPNFDKNKLSEKDLKSFNFVENRITELKEARKQEMYGVNLETIWADADRDYIPHRLKNKGKKMLVEDEDKGWRSAMVRPGDPNWQSDISKPNPFIKIQTALGILVDKNPTGVFTAGSKKYEATSILIKQLYQRSWEHAHSKEQLKLFIYNLSKYGWSCARTYPLKISHKVSNITEYNADDPTKNVYKEKEVTEFNDVFRENLDPWNVWIDDMARPSNQFSLKDWCWRKVYDWEIAEEEFKKYSNWKYVKEDSGIVSEKIDSKAPSKKFKTKKLVEAYFYENRIKDLYEVHLNGVPIIQEPLPISDSKGNKKLSLWQTFLYLRHAECVYGIGFYEAMRYDQAMLDRIRNMTLDQLTMSIYKMFFYQGTQRLNETGEITITPGVGKQVLDPKNMQWMQVPGPGVEAWNGIKMFQQDINEVTGITDALSGGGEQKGKTTAFEQAQKREAGLQRFKLPLDNICNALETEAYISVSLFDLIYSIPETFEIADEKLINDYLAEVKADPQLYSRNPQTNAFTAKVYPEFPLNMDKDEKDNLIETPDTRFFRIKPDKLKWEGIINIKAESILTPSKQLNKALEMEMYNVLIPLLAQPPQLFQKIAKAIVKLYDKDPKDVLPAPWLVEEQPQQPNNSLIVPAGGSQMGASYPNAMAGGAPPPPAEVPGGKAPTLTNRVSLPNQPQGIAQQVSSQLANITRK